MDTMKNVIVGQSGGPTAAINASLAGVFETARALGLGTVYGMRHGIEGLLKGQVIDLSAQLHDSMDVELLKRTPSSFLGSCRFKLPAPGTDDAVYTALFHKLEALEIGYFIYIGGNDSMDTIAKMSDWAAENGSDIKCIGVPKTIDNDLPVTDHTPGYGSAAKYIGTIMKEIVRDSLVYDLKSVTIVEIMGRNAGWLTGAAALASEPDCEGVDMLCLPEVAFDLNAFAARIEELQAHKNNVVIAVSEGIKTADGTYVCELANGAVSSDVFGHKNLTGTAKYLAGEIGHRLACKTRAIELNTLQRCSAHIASRTDITEAYNVGGAAVTAASEGRSGEMVVLHRLSSSPYLCVTEFVDVHAVANQEKLVPRAWITQDSFGVTKDFLTYVYPLIQAELTPIYVNGLPEHLFIRGNF
ncbi:MAG: 6-phosphofructokinase [Ruthenibacterium sp.]